MRNEGGRGGGRQGVRGIQYVHQSIIVYQNEGKELLIGDIIWSTLQSVGFKSWSSLQGKKDLIWSATSPRTKTV